jgi:hypothetical protein
MYNEKVNICLHYAYSRDGSIDGKLWHNAEGRGSYFKPDTLQ